MKLITIALLLAMASSLLMCIWVAISKHQNNKARVFFVIAMLGFAATLGELALSHLGRSEFSHITSDWYVAIYPFTVPLSASIPAFIYLYIRASLNLNSTIDRYDLLHLLVPLIFVIMIMPYYLLDMPARQELFYNLRHGIDVPWLLSITPTRYSRLAMAVVLAAFYCQLCSRDLHLDMNHKKNDVLRAMAKMKKVLWVAGVGGTALIFLFFVIRLPREFTWPFSLLVIMLSLVSSWLFFKLPALGHRWNRHPDQGVAEEVDKSQPVKPKPLADQQPNKGEKSYRSSVSQQMARDSMLKLTALLDEGIYKDATLSLGKLATRLGVSNHHLSQIINQQNQASYYELIHQYRIAEAKRLLAQTQLSIIDITYEVGYNSKSLFYAEFKRQTQLTPSQYKKSLSV